MIQWGNKLIQLYRNAWDTKGMAITASEFLLLPWRARPAVLEYIGKTPEQLREIVRQVRATDKSAERDKYNNLKKDLPQAAFAGTFSKRNAAGIVTRSRLVVVDIDGQDNPDKTPEQIAAIMRDFPEIVYCGQSVGGRGMWAIVQVSTDQHRQHCEQLIKDFAALGVVLDAACIDLPRLRCFSYDPAPCVFRQEAPIYSRWHIPPYALTIAPRISARDNGDICELLDKIIAKRVNICASYGDWLRVAAALQSLGDIGRNYFHALSSIDSRYNEAESERKWAQAATMHRIGFGTIFKMARDAGVMLYDERRNYHPRGYEMPAWWNAAPPKPKNTLPDRLRAIDREAGGELSRLVREFECTAQDGPRIVSNEELLRYLELKNKKA